MAKRYDVRCGECGHRWWSVSVSGRTTCGECGARVYVPVSVRGGGARRTARRPAVELHARPEAAPRHVARRSFTDDEVAADDVVPRASVLDVLALAAQAVLAGSSPAAVAKRPSPLTLGPAVPPWPAVPTAPLGGAVLYVAPGGACRHGLALPVSAPVPGRARCPSCGPVTYSAGAQLVWALVPAGTLRATLTG